MNCHVNLNVGSIAKSVGSEEAEGACPPAGAHRPLVCSQLPSQTQKLSCGRGTCSANPSVTCGRISLLL